MYLLFFIVCISKLKERVTLIILIITLQNYQTLLKFKCNRTLTKWLLDCQNTSACSLALQLVQIHTGSHCNGSAGPRTFLLRDSQSLWFSDWSRASKVLSLSLSSLLSSSFSLRERSKRRYYSGPVFVVQGVSCFKETTVEKKKNIYIFFYTFLFPLSLSLLLQLIIIPKHRMYGSRTCIC